MTSTALAGHRVLKRALAVWLVLIATEFAHGILTCVSLRACRSSRKAWRGSRREYMSRSFYPTPNMTEGEEMAGVARIDEVAYGKLLARTLPRVIETKQENERMIAELEKLDTRGRPLTAEEDKLAQLITVLIQKFEEAHYPLGHAAPVEALPLLMEDQKLRQHNLIHLVPDSTVLS